MGVVALNPKLDMAVGRSTVLMMALPLLCFWCLAYLRSRLTDSDPQIAGIAMMSLGPILTKEDVDTIVRVGSTQPEHAMPAVAALSMSCTPSAKLGIALIEAAYAGTERASDMQRLVEGNAELCGKDGPAEPQTFYGEVAVH